MNWKYVAEDDLRNHNSRKQALSVIPDKIAALEYQKTAIRSGRSDAIPVQGGTSTYEDNIINRTVEQERLKLNVLATQLLVDAVDRGLAALDKQERRILELFYINRQRGHIERLMEEMNVEDSEVYRRKDKAIYKFTTSMYGLSEY